MKKTLIITSEFGREKGGIQNWMFYVRKLLDIYGFDVNVYAYKENNLFGKLTSLFKSQIYFLATWKMSFFITPILLLKKRTIFIFIHGNDILNLNRFQKFWLSYLCGQPHIHFIVNSKAISKITEQEVKCNIDFVQYPFMEVEEQKLPIKPHKIPIFLTISRLVKRKNIYNVVLALGELKKEGLKFIYYIAGEGVEKGRLVTLVEKLHLQEEVKILGKVSEEEKKNLYLECDYFVLPSVYDEENGSIEGYGIVFIEANTYGLPVLGGNTGGMTEAIVDGETGFHCDGSMEDIKKKIIKLVDTNFDDNILYMHAQKHSYRKQEGFLKFIQKCYHE